MAEHLGNPPDSLRDLLGAYTGELVGINYSKQVEQDAAQLEFVGDDFITVSLDDRSRRHIPFTSIMSIDEAQPGLTFSIARRAVRLSLMVDRLIVYKSGTSFGVVAVIGGGE